jgi:hypothetical protein
MDHRELLYIGGEWRKPVTDRRIEVTSASTEESLGSVPEAAEGDIDLASLRPGTPSATRRAGRAGTRPGGGQRWSASPLPWRSAASSSRSW